MGNPLQQILQLLMMLLGGMGGGGCGYSPPAGGFCAGGNPGFGESCAPSMGSGLNNFLGGCPATSFTGGRPSYFPPQPCTGFGANTGQVHRSRGTGYYPHNSRMEGGYKDMRGKPLHTLQDYLAGRAPYVSVAMDNRAGFPYGQRVRIQELEQKYGRPIEFRVVDTGGAFKGRGTSRIDICTANRRASLDRTINGPLTLKFL